MSAKGSDNGDVLSDPNNASNEGGMEWDEVKRTRNRLNSRRTREREKIQMDHLENERSRLYLCNDALRYQNGHLREAIRRVRSREEHTGKPASQQLVLRAPPTNTREVENVSTAARLAHLRNRTLSELASFQHGASLPRDSPTGLASLASTWNDGSAIMPQASSSILGQLGFGQPRGLSNMGSDHILQSILLNAPSATQPHSLVPGSISPETQLSLLLGSGPSALAALQQTSALLQLQDLARLRVPGSANPTFSGSQQAGSKEEDS